VVRDFLQWQWGKERRPVGLLEGFDLKLESLGHVNNSLGKSFHVKDHIWKQEKRKEKIKEKSTNQPVYSLMKKKSRVLFFLSDTCFMLNEDGEYLLEFFY